MFNRPTTDPVTPLSALLAATLVFYVRAFRPLFITAALITVVLSSASALLFPRADAERPESTRGSVERQETEDVGETGMEEEGRSGKRLPLRPTQRTDLSKRAIRRSATRKVCSPALSWPPTDTLSLFLVER